MLKSGVRDGPDVDALAVRSDRAASVLAWNYEDDDVPGPDANVELNISGLPGTVRRVLVRHYRIDQTHSNAYTAWKQMGSPQQPTPEQYDALEAAGQLQLLESPAWREIQDGSAKLSFTLPRQGVSLVQVSW
jgi:xylan 1,4-beta-xylosidase